MSVCLEFDRPQNSEPEADNTEVKANDDLGHRVRKTPTCFSKLFNLGDLEIKRCARGKGERRALALAASAQVILAACHIAYITLHSCINCE